MATNEENNLRRSPRKKTSVQQPSPQKKEKAISISPRKTSRLAARPIVKESACTTKSRKPQSTLRHVPLLPRNTTVSETLRTSDNRRSPSSPQRGLRLAHVDSSLLPLKTLAIQEDDDDEGAVSSRDKTRGQSKQSRNAGRVVKALATKKLAAPKQQISQAKTRQMSLHTSKFVLKEARCDDDEENSNDEDEDEDTDLSGFVVDDDAEISFYNTSSLETDDESDSQRRPQKEISQPAPRTRRLQQGSPTRRKLGFGNESDEDSDKENCGTDSIADGLRNVRLEEKQPKNGKEDVEVIDLTSSPVASPDFKVDSRPDLLSSRPHNAKSKDPFPGNTNLFKGFDAILRFSPPSSKPALMPPSKEVPTQHDPGLEQDNEDQQDEPSDQSDARFKTPPATPPRSPSKLKSPSKLLSPSKRQGIPHSPHRQSMDAFWDHNVINEWNDEYSPKKAPAGSPGKRGLSRFQIWFDSEDEVENDSRGSSSSLPSPCSSPRKSRSPCRSPEKEEKKLILEEKRRAAAEKKAFDSQKEQLAIDLFRELDEKVANNQLASLSTSTGGVKIIWSKTLRSTAGRANWKRTVTKLSGSPIKGNPSSHDSSVKIQHFASIELAEKILDCEDRLVNTLAHEFCHLTNFMISNVRDQPHGASFKKWAQKVTSHLRSTAIPSWQNVQVTTKHNYIINHKYLWVCVGRPRTSAMEFLNVEDDEGCGAEYGRHSKSIDAEKHRCGKCKGLLVQVRPKPRAGKSPVKKAAGRKGVGREGSTESESGSGSGNGRSSQGVGLSSLIEMVELSD